MGCPTERSAMPSRKMRANFVYLASGMVGLLGRTDGIDSSLPPCLPSPLLSTFSALSLSLPLSPHSTDPEAQKSPSLFLSMACTGLGKNTLPRLC